NCYCNVRWQALHHLATEEVSWAHPPSTVRRGRYRWIKFAHHSAIVVGSCQNFVPFVLFLIFSRNRRATRHIRLTKGEENPKFLAVGIWIGEFSKLSTTSGAPRLRLGAASRHIATCARNATRGARTTARGSRATTSSAPGAAGTTAGR